LSNVPSLDILSNRSLGKEVIKKLEVCMVCAMSAGVFVADGAILPVNRRQRVYPNGTLVIEHAQRPADAGTYTCQAQNRQKHTARRDVEVQVLGKDEMSKYLVLMSSL
jgi:hypothetical protein